MGELTGRRIVTAPARFDAEIHEIHNFDCGKPPLNDWLRNLARRSEGYSARTYVVCEGRNVVGYYCISAGSIERAALPSKIKKHGLPNPIPVAIIGRLARDLSYRGRGLGVDLLADAVKRIACASEIIGVRAIIVHALDDDVVVFYQGNGFLPSALGERTFCLPVETVRAAL